ncbi:MAG TPA: aldo/keto reductase [Candidatus Merdenecus merdavium]|nr:aldo/keto reductase [Candidatus Merdenecus merdavium]
MKSVRIKNTDFKLSPIGLGTVKAGLSWDHEESFDLLEGYLKAGGNVIDTAHVYSDWIPGEISRSERVIGDWIRSRNKTDDFILMTKGGHPHMDNMHISRLSKEEMEDDLNGSLETLGVKTVDIYFYHRDDENRSVEELIETMEAFKRADKIRAYGCSNWTTQRMKEAEDYCREKGYRGFVANQAMYNIGVKYVRNLKDPTLVICDEAMLNYHRTSDTLLMPYSGICNGFFHVLKKKGIQGVKSDSYNEKGNLKIAEDLYKLCERKGYSITQALLGFFAVQDMEMVPLVGVSNQNQLRELGKVIETEFTPEDYKFY